MLWPLWKKKELRLMISKNKLLFLLKKFMMQCSRKISSFHTWKSKRKRLKNQLEQELAERVSHHISYQSNCIPSAIISHTVYNQPIYLIPNHKLRVQYLILLCQFRKSRFISHTIHVSSISCPISWLMNCNECWCFSMRYFYLISNFGMRCDRWEFEIKKLTPPFPDARWSIL